MLTLLPFSREELARADAAPENWFDHTFTGGYPRIFDAGLEPTNFYRDYVDTYLERDVRQLSAVRDTSRFQTLLQLCAANVGQILNLSQLAKDCGISQTAAGDWLNLMEASYVLFRLKPGFSNIRKRLVKRPKLYFHDTGVACYLLGLTSPEHVERQPLRGALFENAVVNEIMKFDLNRNRPAELFFFRDSNGNEVDLLYRRGLDLLPIEIKSGQTVSKDYFRLIDRFRQSVEAEVGAAVYTGANARRYDNGQSVIPFHQLPSFLDSRH